MKTKIRAEHASMLEMNDWFAGLRDGESGEPGSPGKAEPAGRDPGYAVPASYGCGGPAGPVRAEPADYVRAVPAGPGYAVPADYVRVGPAAGSLQPQSLAAPAAPAFSARPAARTTPVGPAGAAVRAVIGDQLRMPVIWCEMGSCVSWHADPDALGEADTRARAIAVGWRIDALGRLACPQCQQSNPGFWASHPVAVRDRDMALASTAPIPAVPGGDSIARGAALRRSRDLRRAGRGYPPASGTELEPRHDYPADDVHARGQVSRKPGRYLQSLGVVLNPAGPGERAAARWHLATIAKTMRTARSR